MIAKITKSYIREYTDNGQTTAYVEWVDDKGQSGRTEGNVGPCNCCGRGNKGTVGSHMRALMDRANREGVATTFERW